MKNGKAAIGQVVFTANCVSPQTGRWELLISWVQPGKNLDSLVGAAPEYSVGMFDQAKVKYDSTHGVAFTRQDHMIELRQDQEYAALISWYGENENPFILSACKLEEFRKAQKKNKPSESSVKTRIPNGTFRVKVLNHEFSGELETIMITATREWSEDPTKTLQSEDAVWEKKEGMRYVPTPCPPLPPVNGLVLSLVGGGPLTTPSS